jgi:hypothetical protein
MKAKNIAVENVVDPFWNFHSSKKALKLMFGSKI